MSKKVLDAELIKYKEKANKISEQIDKLFKEQRELQVEATKEIIKTFIKNKNFNEACLTFSYNQMQNPIEKDKPIYLEISCLVDHLRFQIREEFTDLVCDYLPGSNYHFQIEIDDFVTFVGNDYDYGFVFANFDVEKIKTFAKEYGFTIKALGDESRLKDIEKTIQEETIRRDNMLKLKGIFE